MFYTYILASQRSGTLYTGMTEDLVRRMEEHREKVIRGFTAKYDVTQLSLPPLTPDQGMAAALEDRPDRANEPELARSDGRT